MSIDIIHHYTTIESLKAIVKNRTIRFKRLDRVDDMSEETSFVRLKLAPFFFVSSWTSSSEESIPMWDRYGAKMSGVRLSLPKRMFDHRPIEVPPEISPSRQESFSSPLPFEDIFGEQHPVLPMFLNDKHFERQVEYDANFAKMKNEAIEIRHEANGKIAMTIHDPAGIASIKPKFLTS